MDDRMSLTCCKCWKKFEIVGELATSSRVFYARQQGHTTDKEVGVCDECWAKRPNIPELPRPTADYLGGRPRTDGTVANGSMRKSQATPYRWRWYWWLILPLVWMNFAVALVLGAPLSNFYFLYPERRAHVYDARGNLHQRRRLAQWRSRYQRLTMKERIHRAMLVRARRQRNRNRQGQLRSD